MLQTINFPCESKIGWHYPYHYRPQYLCNVIPLGEFKRDTAGNVNKISWIDPSKFEEYIENKELKKMIIRRALELLKNKGYG